MKRTTGIIGITAVILLLGAGLIFFINRYNTPQIVFERMLQSNLSSFGASRTMVQDSGSRVVQTVQAQTGAVNVISGNTNISQAAGDTVIETESLGTPTSDYIRYSAISTSQLGAEGNELNFDSVLGQWGESVNGDPTIRSGELFGEATLGIVPFGRLDAESRADTVSFVVENDVYGIDYETVQKQTTEQGRKVYVYEANIEPAKYVEMLIKFAAYVNSAQLEGIDPAQFKDSPDIQVTMSIDILSGQLVSVSFADGSREETYSAYGAVKEILFPDETISISELQQKLQTIR